MILTYLDLNIEVGLGVAFVEVGIGLVVSLKWDSTGWLVDEHVKDLGVDDAFHFIILLSFKYWSLEINNYNMIT